jgi:hypothetical protein
MICIIIPICLMARSKRYALRGVSAQATKSEMSAPSFGLRPQRRSRGAVQRQAAKPIGRQASAAKPIECVVCADRITRVNDIVTACSNCSQTFCRRCVRRYVCEGPVVNPKCPGCVKGYTRRALIAACGASWVDTEYHRKRAAQLFETERALLPATQEIITRKQDAHQRQILDIMLRAIRMAEASLRRQHADRFGAGGSRGLSPVQAIALCVMNARPVVECAFTRAIDRLAYERLCHMFEAAFESEFDEALVGRGQLAAKMTQPMKAPLGHNRACLATSSIPIGAESASPLRPDRLRRWGPCGPDGRSTAADEETRRRMWRDNRAAYERACLKFRAAVVGDSLAIRCFAGGDDSDTRRARTDTRPRDPLGRTDTRPRDPLGRTDTRPRDPLGRTDTRPRDPLGRTRARVTFKCGADIAAPSMGDNRPSGPDHHRCRGYVTYADDDRGGETDRLDGPPPGRGDEAIVPSARVPIGAMRLFCGLCAREYCRRCHELRDDDDAHACDASNVASVRLMKRDTKACPTCAAPIYKIYGCDQMWCTACNTAFDWRSLELIKRRVHNPHYLEYARLHPEAAQRRDGNGVAECGVVQCDADVSVLALGAQRFTDRIVNFRGLVLHVEQVEIPLIARNDNAAEQVNDEEEEEEDGTMHNGHTGDCKRDRCRVIFAGNRDLRMRYLLGEIAEDAFRKTLHSRQKLAERDAEIADVLRTLVAVGTDLLATHVRMWLDFNERDDTMQASIPLRPDGVGVTMTPDDALPSIVDPSRSGADGAIGPAGGVLRGRIDCVAGVLAAPKDPSDAVDAAPIGTAGVTGPVVESIGFAAGVLAAPIDAAQSATNPNVVTERSIAALIKFINEALTDIGRCYATTAPYIDFYTVTYWQSATATRPTYGSLPRVPRSMHEMIAQARRDVEEGNPVPRFMHEMIARRDAEEGNLSTHEMITRRDKVMARRARAAVLCAVVNAREGNPVPRFMHEPMGGVPAPLVNAREEGDDEHSRRADDETLRIINQPIGFAAGPSGPQGPQRSASPLRPGGSRGLVPVGTVRPEGSRGLSPLRS